MEITVQLFGIMRYMLGSRTDCNQFTMDCEPGTTVKAILDTAGISEVEKFIVTVNHRTMGFNDIPQEGDVLKVFPLMSGG